MKCLFMIFELRWIQFRRVSAWCAYFQRFWDEAIRQDGRYARTGRGINAHNAPFLFTVSSKLAALSALLTFPAHASCQGGARQFFLKVLLRDVENAFPDSV